MDQELIAYLEARFTHIDERFRETSQQIETLREETSRHFEQIDSRFEGIDSRFEQIDSRFEQIDSRFEKVETEIRHTQVSIEGLRREVCIVAEGVMGVDERLKPARKDYLQDFEDVRALIRTTYSNLDNRTFALESWRERTERDPIELIRERFGKTPGKTSG
jgi:chromosome segregation ATPase